MFKHLTEGHIFGEYDKNCARFVDFDDFNRLAIRLAEHRNCNKATDPVGFRLTRNEFLIRSTVLPTNIDGNWVQRNSFLFLV